MSDIYVVTSGSYSDYSIRGVFSSREKAWRYIENTREHCSDYNYIEVWAVDKEENKVVRRVYRTIMPQGDSWSSTEISEPSARTPDSYITEAYNGNFVAYSYVSEEHSKKLAVEEYQRRLREKVHSEGV